MSEQNVTSAPIGKSSCNKLRHTAKKFHGIAGHIDVGQVGLNVEITIIPFSSLLQRTRTASLRKFLLMDYYTSRARIYLQPYFNRFSYHGNGSRDKKVPYHW